MSFRLVVFPPLEERDYYLPQRLLIKHGATLSELCDDLRWMFNSDCLVRVYDAEEHCELAQVQHKHIQFL